METRCLPVLSCFSYPPEAVARGHGADESEALLDLWTTLTARPESADAVSIVPDAYTRHTDESLSGRTGASDDPLGCAAARQLPSMWRLPR